MSSNSTRYACICVYLCIPHFLYPFLHWWALRYFQTLTVVNNAAVNIGVCISFQITIFVYFWEIPSSGMAGSYGSSTFNFTWYLTNLHTFSLWLHQFTFPPTRYKDSFFYNFLHNSLFFASWITVILTGIRRYLTVILISIFLITGLWNIFPRASCPSVCLLWKNIYSALLFIV